MAMRQASSAARLRMRTTCTAWALLCLVAGAQAAAVYSAPSPVYRPQLHHEEQPHDEQPQKEEARMIRYESPVYSAQAEDGPEARKYAEKSNALKKVGVDNDLDDVSTNSIQSGEGFSWSSMLSTLMQLLFNPQTAPSKSDSIDADQGMYQSPWTNILTMGLKILSAFISGTSGGAGGDGIDKVDNGSPMQGILAAVLSAFLGNRNPDQVATMAKQAGEFINIVVNLLDALKTSFSHRYMEARNIGRKDSVAEAALAGLTMLKGYVRTMKTSDDTCAQRLLCDATRECTTDTSGAIFCQLGAYAASFVLERSSPAGTPFSAFYDASRQGRSGADCRQAFLACNEV